MTRLITRWAVIVALGGVAFVALMLLEQEQLAHAQTPDDIPPRMVPDTFHLRSARCFADPLGPDNAGDIMVIGEYNIDFAASSLPLEVEVISDVVLIGYQDRSQGDKIIRTTRPVVNVRAGYGNGVYAIYLDKDIVDVEMIDPLVDADMVTAFLDPPCTRSTFPTRWLSPARITPPTLRPRRPSGPW